MASLEWQLMDDAVRQKIALRSTIDTDVRWVGKVMVITGAGGQLGRQGCIYFAARGAIVVALDLNPQGLEETYTEIRTHVDNNNSFDYKPYVCNVTDAASVDAVVADVVKRYQRIDCLWNNAGYQGQITPILSQTPEDFANVMNINVTGMFIVLQAVAKRMVLAQGDGASSSSSSSSSCAIVNTASVAGLRGTPAMVGYASSKAAVLALTVCAAKEFAHVPIRVNAISPALIGPGTLWERQNELHAAVGAPYFGDTPDAVAAAKIKSVPMQRLGTADEVVKSVAFLLSDEASYTTGINLTVDGGMAAGLKA